MTAAIEQDIQLQRRLQQDSIQLAGKTIYLNPFLYWRRFDANTDRWLREPGQLAEDQIQANRARFYPELVWELLPPEETAIKDGAVEMFLKTLELISTFNPELTSGQLLEVERNFQPRQNVSRSMSKICWKNFISCRCICRCCRIKGFDSTCIKQEATKSNTEYSCYPLLLFNKKVLHRPSRTPSASSCANSLTARNPAASSGASRRAFINAEPTITPSAYPATERACSRVDTPSPTLIGVSVVLRTRATKSDADEETLVRVPVTPIKLAA